MRNTLAAYTLAIALSAPLSSAIFASDDIGMDEVNGPLGTKFSVPMEFTTDTGTLSLTITNDPEEKNQHYMRVLSLPNQSEFVAISHNKYMDGILAAIEAVEELESNMAEPSQTTGSEPTSPLPVKKASRRNLDNPIYPLAMQKYESEMVDKFAFPKSVMTLHWKYTITGEKGPQTDLRIFPTNTPFNLYVYNNFIEQIRAIEHEKESKDFDEVHRRLFT